jgi:hypothetical protein
MGYVASAVEAEDLTVTILGEPRPARLLHQAAFDPAGQRMRS